MTKLVAVLLAFTPWITAAAMWLFTRSSATEAAESVAWLTFLAFPWVMLLTTKAAHIQGELDGFAEAADMSSDWTPLPRLSSEWTNLDGGNAKQE